MGKTTKCDPATLTVPSESGGDRQFTLVLDQADHERLRHLAYQRRLPMTSLVRAAIKDWIAEQ